MFSKTTLLEGFKQSSNIVWREDGKTPYREFSLDEKLLPEPAQHMEGDWEITVRFTPRKTSYGQRGQETSSS